MSSDFAGVKREGSSHFFEKSFLAAFNPNFKIENFFRWLISVAPTHRVLRQYSIIRPMTAASINSASVDDMATVGCNIALYPTTPPANTNAAPPMERLVLGHVAHSESVYPNILSAP